MTKTTKFTKFFAAGLCMTSLALVGCSSGDINSVYKGEQVTPGTNPLSTLTPNASFSWSTMNSAKITIEVDDKFDSKYDYRVSLYTYHPMSVSDNANAIFTGVARGNTPLTRTIDLPSSANSVYVQVIDPQGYETVYGYAAPTKGANITFPCQIGEPAVGSTKTVATRADVNVADVDFMIPDHQEFPTFDLTVPSNAVELPKSSQWNKDAVYVVPANKTIDLDGDSYYSPATPGGVRIYVEGTLDIDGKFGFYNGAHVYIMDGGKVKSNSDEIKLYQDAVLYVAEGGKVDVSKITTEGENTLLYVAGEARIKDELSFNNAGASIYVAPTGKIIGEGKSGKFDLKYLQGDLYVDSDENASGLFECEKIEAKNTTHRIIVAPNATLDVNTDVIFYGSIYNGGTFSAKKVEGNDGSEPKVYNACTMIVKEDFTKISALYMKHGTLSGGVTADNKNNLKFSKMKKYQPSFTNNVYLIDGSYIYTEEFIFGTGGMYGLNTDGDDATSLVQASKKLESSNKFALQGNLAYQCKNKYIGDKIVFSEGVVSSDIDALQLDLRTCTGAIVDRGEDTTPPQPVEDYTGAAQAEYTVNFEDQWPVVGDYDVNDIVLHVSSITTTQNSNYVKQAVFNFELLAVGASYDLGMGLQFAHITNAQIANVTHSLTGNMGTAMNAFDLNEKGIESGSSNDKAILPLFYDAHKMFSGTSSRSPLNTGSTRQTGRSFTITFDFADNANVTSEDLKSSALDYFIYRPEDKSLAVGGGSRIEVHLKGFAPTRNVVNVYFGDGNDNGSRTYTTTNNFPWGIVVSDIPPTDNHKSTAWSWPSESKLITNEYSSFAQWVNSNGTTNTDWMQ